MYLQNQVCSLELSKRLKELGVLQDSLFYWFQFRNESSSIEHWENTYTDLIRKGEKRKYNERDYLKDKIYYSAFTAAELGEILPHLLQADTASKKNSHLETLKDIDNRWLIAYATDEIAPPRICIIEKNEANARARMLIYLLENKLMELQK